MGRFLDGLACILDIRAFNTYEGEAAMLLENKIRNYDLKSCRSYLSDPEKGISATEIIKNMHADFQSGNPTKQLILNFLYTLAYSILAFAKNKNYKNIAFSGGVFQNTTLVDIIIELAPKEIKLYFHKDLSPNDENVSFGQLMYYLNTKK